MPSRFHAAELKSCCKGPCDLGLLQCQICTAQTLQVVSLQQACHVHNRQAEALKMRYVIENPTLHLELGGGLSGEVLGMVLKRCAQLCTTACV